MNINPETGEILEGLREPVWKYHPRQNMSRAKEKRIDRNAGLAMSALLPRAIEIKKCAVTAYRAALAMEEAREEVLCRQQDDVGA